MNAQVKSQILGLSLAVSTAVGCIAYEKLVKAFSLSTIIFCALAFYVPLFLALLILDYPQVTGELRVMCSDPKLRLAGFVYYITWITTPIWFAITKNQDVMVSSIYEVKYIVVLAVGYVFLGSRPMTWNTAIGVMLALVSIYFISKK